MPQISAFFGISVCMYYSDHNPPHFHAIYGNSTALIDIRNGSVLEGFLPPKQTKLVLAWCEIHREELEHDWGLCKNCETLVWISPLQ